MVTKNYLKHIEDTYRSAGVPKPLRGPAATRLFRGSNPFPRFIFFRGTSSPFYNAEARPYHEQAHRPQWASALSEVEL